MPDSPKGDSAIQTGTIRYQSFGERLIGLPGFAREDECSIRARQSPNPVLGTEILCRHVVEKDRPFFDAAEYRPQKT